MTFSDLNDPRLESMISMEGRSTARLAQLLLQAAYREGMLERCELKEEGDDLIFSAHGEQLKVRGRILAAGDRLVLERKSWQLTLEQFLEKLRLLCGVDFNDRWQALCEEVKEGHLTQAAAYALAQTRRRPLDYLDFEAWTPEGHNLHPGAKTRAGFTASDQLAYAPEFSDGVNLIWLEVEKELLQHSGRVDAHFETSDSAWLVPVHPWQYKNVIPELYSDELKGGRIRKVDKPELLCRLCSSLRTVVPVDPQYPVLKLSVGSLMTSTERSMSRHTVLQGPIYTEYLRRIFEGGESYTENVVALEEFGGLCWAEEQDERRSRNLSLLFRQRPPEIQPDEVAVPCSSLPQPAWGQELTYLEEFFARGPGPLANFRTYLRLMLPFHLGLYLDHGLALEAHLQNCVVVWDSAGPTTLWVRDWGGLRANSAVLAKKAPDLFSRLDSRSVTLADAQTAEKKLIACLYCNHVTEIVAGLSHSFKLSENELWSEVRDVTESCFENSPEVSLRSRLLHQDWPVKCLLRMRLGLGGEGDVYHLRKNPL